MSQPQIITTDVLVVGAGGAGMYAALAAARDGAAVVLVDKNMIGRGGATIMAQMTVAAALSEAEPDTWQEHYQDTLTAGRGLCDPQLAERVCRLAPERMREMDDWGVGWARKDDHISQVMAPGHSVARCCYVDFLNTGPAVAQTLRRKLARVGEVRRLSDVTITELIVADGTVIGAHGLEGANGTSVIVSAGAVVIATGGLTKLFSRSSASTNMSGEGYALALAAGADLIDMEFVQFFPIGHLAPRLVGMDPIMWDPFRYKLGGRLLNSKREAFMQWYGDEDDGKYTAPRDTTTYAIYKENQAGRGSPHGGAWLSFEHLSEAELRCAFGPVIDRLAKNGIDLGSQAIEVSPIAHYHMGGIRVDVDMQSTVPGLYAAGEAVGGASGANRLSGNAISEALVFGDIAGANAARVALAHRHRNTDLTQCEPVTGPRRAAPGEQRSTAAMMHELKQLMWRRVGPFRDKTGLTEALGSIQAMRQELRELPVEENQVFANLLFEWYEMQAALLVSESVTATALAREESRGAHQREDFPDTLESLAHSQNVSLSDGQLISRFQ